MCAQRWKRLKITILDRVGGKHFCFPSLPGLRTPHHTSMANPLWLLGTAQLITVCNLGPISPSAVAGGWGKVLLICHDIGTNFHLENFLNIIPQSFSLNLDFQWPQTPTDLFEEWSGSYNSASWGRERRWNWGLGAGQQLGVGTYSKSGVSTFWLFPFWLVIFLLWVLVSAPEKWG